MGRERVLVTGATGFAGSHLLDRLGERDPVVAWFRPGGTPPDTGRTVDWEGVDLTSRAAVEAGMRAAEPTRVFHLAGAPSVAASWSSVVPHLQINALGTHHVLEAIRVIGRPCRVLVVSSSQVYRPVGRPIHEDDALGPQSPYGLSKLAQDQLALQAASDDGLEVLLARPFNHIGPRQAPTFAISYFASQIARMEAGQAPPILRVGNLEARRDVTDVRDVVEAYVRIMEHGAPGRPYNVCSGHAWRIGDLLAELQRLADRPLDLETDPSRLRPADTPIVEGDPGRIRAELGWSPHIGVEQGLRDTLDWWRAEVHAGR